MHKPPENRLNSAYAQTIIRALRHIERDLIKPGNPGKSIPSTHSFMALYGALADVIPDYILRQLAADYK